MIQRLHLAYTPSRRCFALAVSSSRVRLWVVPDMPSHARTNDTMHLAHVIDVETGRSGIVGLSFLDDQTLLVAHSDGVLQAWALLVGEDSAVHLKVPLKGHFETLPSLHGDTEAASTMDLLGELNQLKQGNQVQQAQHGTFRTFTQRPVEIEGQSLKARLVWSLTLDGRMESCAIWHEFSTWDTVRLALGTQAGDVFVVEVTAGQQPQTMHFEHHQSTVSLVSFSRDGLLLATCSRQRDIAIWRVRDEKQKPWRQFKGSGGEIWALKFSPSGRYIISGGIDNSVYYWDILAKRPLRAMNRDHDGWIAALAWSDDERVVASASWDNTIGLFRAGDMAPLYCFDFHEDYVVDVLFAPETNYLISASYDHQIAVWDWRHAQLVAKLEGHEDWVQSLVWMGNGMVASAASDKTVRVWSIEALKCEYLLCDKVRPASDIDLADPFSLGSAFSSSSWASDEPYQPIVHDTGFGKQRVSGTEADASVQRAVEAVQHVEETGLGEVSMFFDDAPSMFNPKQSTIDQIESRLPAIEEPSLVSDAEEVDGLPGSFDAPLMPMRQSTADELGEALFEQPTPPQVSSDFDDSIDILEEVDLLEPDDDATKEFKLDMAQVDVLRTPPTPIEAPAAPPSALPKRETASWPASLNQPSAASVSGDEIFAASEASSAVDAPSKPKSDLDITAEALDIVPIEESEADSGWDWEFSEASASASEVFEDSQPSEISEQMAEAVAGQVDVPQEVSADDSDGAQSLEAYLQSVVQSETSSDEPELDENSVPQDLVEISLDEDGPEEIVDVFALEELSLSERVSSVVDEEDDVNALVESSITDDEASNRDQVDASGFSFPSMSASMWGGPLGQSASEGLGELSMVNWDHYERSGFGQPAMLLDGSNSEVSIMTESIKAKQSPVEDAREEVLEEVSTPPVVEAHLPEDVSSEQEAISDVEAFAVDALSQPSESLSVAVSVPIDEDAPASQPVSNDDALEASNSEPVVDDEQGSTSSIQALAAPVETSSSAEDDAPIAGIEVEIQMVPASSDTSDAPVAPSAPINDVVPKPQHDWGDFDDLSDAVEEALSIPSETPAQETSREKSAVYLEAPFGSAVDARSLEQSANQTPEDEQDASEEGESVGATQEDVPVLEQSSDGRSDVLELEQPEGDLMEPSELAPEAALSLNRPRESGGFVMLDEFSMAEESMSSSASHSSSASQTPSSEMPAVDVPEAVADDPSSEIEEGAVPDSFDAPPEASELMERSEYTETKEFSRVALKQALRRKMLEKPDVANQIQDDFQTQPNIVDDVSVEEDPNEQTNTGWNQEQISDAFKVDLNESLDRHSDQETLSQNTPQHVPSFNDREQTVVDASPAGMMPTLDGRERKTILGHAVSLPDESEALELEPVSSSDARSNSKHVVDDIFERAETVADASPLWGAESNGESQLPGRRPRLMAEGEASQLGAKEALSEQTRPEDVAFEQLLQQVPEVENVSGTIGFGSPMPAFALQQLKEQTQKARASKYKPMPEDVCETFELTISETWQMRLAERKAAMKIFKKRKSAGNYRRWDRLESHHDRIDHVSYCEEGRFYVVAGDQPVIEIWTLKQGRVGTLATNAPVKHVVVTSDGRVVIAGDDAGVLQMWLLPTNVTTMSQSALGMVSIDGPGRVRGLSLDAHGRYLFSAHQSGVGRLWDLVDGSHVATMHHHGGDILGVGFESNGPISSSEDHILRFWNTEGQVDGLIGGAGELTQLVGRQRDLYALSVDGELHSYKNQEHQSSVSFDDYPVDLDVNHDGMLAIAGESGKIYLYPTGLDDDPIELNMGEAVCSIAICGPFVVVGTKDGGLELLKRT